MTVQDLLHRTRTFFHFIGRLLYRLSRWGNRPLSEEQLRWIGKLRDAAGYKRGYKDALEKPIAQVVQPVPPQPPERHTDPTTVLQHLPPGALSRRVHDEIQVSGKLPRISGVLRSMKQGAFRQSPPLTQDMPLSPTPKRTVPLVPPVDHINTLPTLVPEGLAPEVRKLFHDMSWLNDKEGETPHDPFPAPIKPVEEDDGNAVTEQRPAMPKKLNAHFYPHV